MNYYILNKKELVTNMDFSKLHWRSDWMYSDVFGDTEEDIAIGLYSIPDFPSIHLYIDYEANKIIDVWITEKC